MNENLIHIGDFILDTEKKAVKGEIVTIENELYYKISNYDKMPPFLMNIVSNSDLWMFISSNGSLTAGRRNPDHALFPYYTDDKIHDSQDITGNKTIIFVKIGSDVYLWEPFSLRYKGVYKTENNIYKNIVGNKLIFEEVNLDLSVSFQYSWQNCDRFGFIKKSKIVNNSSDSIFINILDGIQNILPSGTDRKFQLEYSTLLDGYKKNELLEDIGLALYTLSSIPTDKAEPSEALRATTVWSVGLENAIILLSSKQIDLFRSGNQLIQETNTKALRGAYLIQSEFELTTNESKEWYIVADLDKDHSEVVALSSLLHSGKKLKQLVDNEISKDTENLKIKIAQSDGFQLTNDLLVVFRHFSNVLFNIMRGGLFENNYQIDKVDFLKFIKTANSSLSEKHSAFFEKLPSQLNKIDLIDEIEKLNDSDLEKLCYEYLPLSFSRRHGDPSRPWNLFSINIKDEHGNKILNYQGNWRDIFQNWEALAHSFPYYIENMIVKFVNASTADGYNPYRVTRDGFEWEELDPSDVWSYIGYWGDHQIIYLLKLLELSTQYNPGIVESFLTKEIFAYANVPYRIKPYESLLKDPRNTIDFDFELNAEIKKRVKEIGTDGKFIWNDKGEIYHVNLSEKLLVTILTKLSNFIPEAGIWMNTQRPEWNDANNALVGFGASMVTLYYLRRFVTYCIKLFKEVKVEQIRISEEVFEFFIGINETLLENQFLLRDSFPDRYRKIFLDKVGSIGSSYRSKIYSKGFSGKQKTIIISDLILFFLIVLKYIDHSIRSNKRKDGLYHSYNLIKIREDEICISNLYEMLEGQVAILSSGFLSMDESIVLIDSLMRSSLYRKDQHSFMLYPERELPRFIEKNIIPKELYQHSKLLMKMIEKNDNRIVVQDINGNIHFNSNFRNSAQLMSALTNLDDSYNELIEKEKQLIIDIYESIFNHHSFTGRSGTFYKYEGIGCIYWHMVSKLLLAIQETYYRGVACNFDESKLKIIKEYYYDIREGIGTHKSPDLYGAFPIDPYSHTPKGMGVQQPGLTGQVKEDIISRFGELGIIVEEGKIRFNHSLLNKSEFLSKSQVFNYYDVNGLSQSLILNSEMLAFTICQVPVIYMLADEEKIIIAMKDGTEEVINGLTLSDKWSKSIFRREGIIANIIVFINK